MIIIIVIIFGAFGICYLRNRKHFLCFHTVIETQVTILKNEKLKWEHEPLERVFPRYISSFPKLPRVFL